jgi:long-chain acyl-CoA synthetase
VSRANVACLLDGPSRWAADRPAILLGDEPVRTWAQLGDAVARRAGALRDRLGVTPGDPVALFATNCAEYLEILFAIWHAGGVAVPINSRLHAREAGSLVRSSRAKACFATADVADGLLEVLDGAVPVVVAGEQDYAALLGAEPVAPVAREPGDDAWIFFTSGTTGRAKGARITHGNLLAMTAAYYADIAELSPRDSIIHVAALSHASGLFALPFAARAAAHVLPPSGRFDAAELLALIGAGGRSTFFVPPTLLRRLSAAPQLGETPLDRLGTVLVGAAPVRPDDLRLGVGALGPRLWNGYGQGETPLTITAMSREAIAAAIRDGDDERLGSVGVARFATRVRLVDEHDREVPVGAVGEVVVDGPTVMAGYLAMPDATSRALRGGWLHTGDCGRFGPGGHLTLVDRAKDVVITGGYNVYPREVEDVLLADPSVGEAAVVGIPDPEWGERVVAYLVAAPRGQIDPTVLDRRCLDAIARHKRPKEYIVVAELPRNAAGKVLKQTLREQYAPTHATEEAR